MITQRQKVHGIIHTASVNAALVWGGLAQIPESDMLIICGIQTAMILAIAHVRGTQLSKAAAADLLLTFGAGYGGRALSEVLVGWIPLLGNLINATTAASLTEAIGWAANAYFDNDKKKED